MNWDIPGSVDDLRPEIDAISGRQAPCRYLEISWAIWALEQFGEHCEVLDFGCGMKAFALMAARRGHVVSAVDFEPRAVQRQEDLVCRGPAMIAMTSLLVDDPGGLPFIDDMFDAVFAISAIENLCWSDDKADTKAFAEIKRVLRPGGLFFWSLPVGRRYLENRYEGKSHPSERVYTPGQLYSRMRGYETLFSRWFVYDSGRLGEPAQFVGRPEDACRLLWFGLKKSVKIGDES